MARQVRLAAGPEPEITIPALKQASSERGVPEIRHSDQGVEYAVAADVELMMSCRAPIGRASTGVPEENGLAGRLMRTIKEEGARRRSDEEVADAWRPLGRFLDEVDNTRQLHSASGNSTPSEPEQQWLDAKTIG